MKDITLDKSEEFILIANISGSDTISDDLSPSNYDNLLTNATYIERSTSFHRS